MSGGLLALLDDIAVIARLAAASIDDIGAAAVKASSKAVGVVIDDAAVTPRYVTGFRPERELPIIKRIAIGSLRNKLFFILPAILLLSQFVPWIMTPLLMLGGVYLCFEGAEKVHEAFVGSHHKAETDAEQLKVIDSTAHEEKMISGAIRTDFILSAEIMVISLAEVVDQAFWMRTVTLFFVALFITGLVYGVVALIVKMDDFGLYLAHTKNNTLQFVGRTLVQGMPKVLSLLAVIGTAAMLWVGGHILIDGLHKLHIDAPYKMLHDLTHTVTHALHGILPNLPEWMLGLTNWTTETILSALLGVLVGGLVVMVLHFIPHKKH